MIIYKKIKKKVRSEIERICDKCKYKFTIDDAEWHDFHHIHFTGGYGSIWGDSNTVAIDLCDECLYSMFKDIANVTSH